MSGHSKWAGIKHQKGVTDKKRGVLFSKLCAAVTAATKQESNPDFNPRLRDCIKKAKDAQVPAENIDRAIKRASNTAENIEEILCEAYGPGGSALLIEAITDNRNRTIPQIKKVLRDAGGKWAESGSVQWAFERNAKGHESEANESETWVAKFPQKVSGEDKEKLTALIEALEEHEEVQRVITNSD